MSTSNDIPQSSSPSLPLRIRNRIRKSVPRSSFDFLTLRAAMAAAAIFHIVVTLSVFSIGRFGLYSQQIDSDGIGQFARDGYRFRNETELLANTLVQDGVVAWLANPLQIHIKLYSLSFVLLGRVLGSNILVAEPINLSSYLVILATTFNLAKRIAGQREAWLASAIVALWPTLLLHTTQFLRDPILIAAFLILVLTDLITRVCTWSRNLIAGMTGAAVTFVLWMSRPDMWLVFRAIVFFALVLVAIRMWREKKLLVGNLTVIALLFASMGFMPQVAQSAKQRTGVSLGAFARDEGLPLWEHRSTLWIMRSRQLRLGARLSTWPSRILNNSQKSVHQHAAIGYETSRTVVIPNGFETESFVPSEESRVSVRSELGMPADTILVGRIGRYHHTKDHPTFLRAAALLLTDYPDTQFLLAGKDVDWNNGEVRTLVQDLGLVERVHLLGERLDIPRLTAALDMATSSSHAEGFPNVIGEAMSCAVPCVVTDVGDSASLVGDTGRAVAPQDREALAAAWKAVIELRHEGRSDLGTAARSRVIRRYSLASVVEQYESLYQTVIAEGTASSTKAARRSLSSAGKLPAPEFERVDEPFSEIRRSAFSSG